MKAFSEALLARFEDRAIAHLRQRFQQALSQTEDDELRKRIRAGKERAELYSVVSESDLLRYLEYSVEYGPDFDAATSWAPSILQAEASGTKKMDDLDNWTTFRLRQ